MPQVPLAINGSDTAVITNAQPADFRTGAFHYQVYFGQGIAIFEANGGYIQRVK
jgi:hypothetical protein